MSGQPASVAIGSPFALTVEVEDGDGNVITSYDGPVTLNLVGGTGGTSLGGTLTVDAVNGVATFPGLVLSTAGTYAIGVQSSGLQSTSLSVPVVAPPDAATRWVVSVAPPVNVMAGSFFGLQAQADDNDGNLVSSFTTGQATVQLSSSSATSPNGAVLGSVTIQNGRASLTGLTVSTPGVYTLWISGGGLIPTSLGDFVVSPALAAAPYVTSVSNQTNSRKGLTSITVAFDEALDAVSAEDGDLYVLDLATKKRGKTVYQKQVRLRSIQYNGQSHTVTLLLAKPTKGRFQLDVREGIMAADGGVGSGNFTGLFEVAF